MNDQTLSYFPSNCSYIQQVPQSYIFPNISYSNQNIDGRYSTHLCMTNNECNAIMSLSQQQQQYQQQQQQQLEMSKAYQMKQEQIWMSNQRHMEEMKHMNSYPQIRHHCVIKDRMDKDDSRYADFMKQVQNNECHFEENNNAFNGKEFIAQKMNAQRLSTLDEEAITLSRNSSRESFVRVNGECVDNNSDEEMTNNVANGYLFSPSPGSSVSNNDTLPTCNPGDSTPLFLSKKEHTTPSRTSLTCLRVLEDWCCVSNEEESGDGEVEADVNDNEDDEYDESFVVDYALINEELDKLEMSKNASSVKRESLPTYNPPPVDSRPAATQIPVFMTSSGPMWINAGYMMPMVAMPFPYQTGIPDNSHLNGGYPFNAVYGTGHYVNEQQLGYFA